MENIQVVYREHVNFSFIKNWASKGFWAVLDQGFFSGANFIVNILLARWLAPKEYGAFAVALSVFYLLAGFHTAVLTEPMMVFGAGKYREHFRKYLGMLLYGHWGISLLIALGLGGAAFVMKRLGSPEMAQALAGLAIASPFMLLLWLTRRACYVPMQPGWAAVGSGLNLLLVLTGVFLLWWGGLLTSFSGLVLLGVTAGAASFFITFTKLRPQVQSFIGNPTVGMVVHEHFSYGRWSAGTVLLMWIPGNIAYTLLPIWAGLEGSAQVRAVMNFILPVLQALSAVSLLILPYFSSVYIKHGVSHLKKKTFAFLILFLGAAFSYAVLILVLSYNLLTILYKGKYTEIVGLLPFAVLLPFAAGMNAVVGAALRAMEQPQKVFYSYIFTCLVALTLGVTFIVLWKVKGALASMVLSTFTTSAAMTWFLVRERSTGVVK